MPRAKKKARDLTDEEIAKKLFPKKVREKVEKEVGAGSKSSSRKKHSR